MAVQLHNIIDSVGAKCSPNIQTSSSKLILAHSCIEYQLAKHKYLERKVTLQKSERTQFFQENGTHKT